VGNRRADAGSTPVPTSPRTLRSIASFPPVIPQNPYQRLLYAELADHGYRLELGHRLKLAWLWRRRKQAPILHFHWPQGYYVSPVGRGRVKLALSWLRVAMFTVRLACARLLGYPIVWTIHEVYPHETVSRRVDRAAESVLARMSCLLLAHDRATADLAAREFGLDAEEIAIVPHAAYLSVYPPGRDRETMRAELGIPSDAVVFLSFGHIRAYKDFGVLMDAFTALEQEDVNLVVAGMVMDEQSGDLIRAGASRDGRIKPLLEFVPDANVRELFEASDVAVTSRGDGGTSGALILALSLGLPSVATHTDAYSDLTLEEEAGWLFEPGDRDSLTRALEAAANDPNRTEKGVAAARLAEGLQWPEAAARTAQLLEDAVGGRG
jgi:glycosyltransferase involved in cell wall biosynthesis